MKVEKDLIFSPEGLVYKEVFNNLYQLFVVSGQMSNREFGTWLRKKENVDFMPEIGQDMKARMIIWEIKHSDEKVG